MIGTAPCLWAPNPYKNVVNFWNDPLSEAEYCLLHLSKNVLIMIYPSGKGFHTYMHKIAKAIDSVSII